jgi:hypothetical protein
LITLGGRSLISSQRRYTIVVYNHETLESQYEGIPSLPYICIRECKRPSDKVGLCTEPHPHFCWQHITGAVRQGLRFRRLAERFPLGTSRKYMGQPPTHRELCAHVAAGSC